MRVKRIPILTLCMFLLMQFFAVEAFAATSVDANTNPNANKYASDWRYWSQGATKYNTPNAYEYSLFQHSGCRVVAQAKLLMDTGVASGDAAFNPDTYIEWAHDSRHRYFGDSRSIVDYIGELEPAGKAPEAYAKEKGKTLTYVGQINFSSDNSKTQAKEIMNYLSSGYYVIVGRPAHHVYISRGDSIAKGEPVICDSQHIFSYWDGLVKTYSSYSSQGKPPFKYMRVYSTGSASSSTNSGTDNGPTNGPTDTEITVKITTTAATNVTSTSAQLNGSLSASGSVHITEHGAYLGTSTSNMTQVAKDTVNYSKSSLTMFYNTAKYGITLQQNTTYYYYQYAIVNGEKKTGSIVSFKTPPGTCTTHTKGTYLWAEAAHPHYNYYTCSVCGAQFTDGSTATSSSCAQCKQKTTSVTVRTTGATNITSSSARMNGNLSASGTVHITEHGAYLGTSTSNMTLVARDVVDYNKSSLTMFYDTTKYGPTLQSNTTYYYYQYVIVNGERVNGSVVSFTTPPDPRPTPTPPAVSTTPEPTTPEPTNPEPISPPAAPVISISSTTITEGETAILSWADVPNSTNYDVQIEDVSSSWGSSFISMFAKSPYTVSDLEAGVYQIKVTAFGPGGSSGPSNIITLTVTPKVTVQTPSAANTRIGVIVGTSGALAINDKPAASPKNSTQIGRIPEGASCTVYPDKTSGNWYWVEYNGVSGYAYKNYITLR